MRAKLDENLPVEAIELLRAAGWDCDTVHDEGLEGAEDPRIGAACRTEGRVLFTLDLDFADILAYPPNEYVGIVVFRPAEPSTACSSDAGSGSSCSGRALGRSSALDCRAGSCPCAGSEPDSCLTAHAPGGALARRSARHW